ncbi:AMIN domain-containing protein, partial [Mesorhizobium sp. M1E.F.Ca.ET.041.01.1.1]
MELAGTADKGRGAAGYFRLMARTFFLLTILLGLTAASRADAVLGATGYKVAGDATKVRIVLTFDRKPDVKWFLLRGPNRLVVDLPRTRFALSAKDVKPRGLVRAVRFGDQGKGSRLILTGKGPFAVDKLDVLKNDDGNGYRIAIDMSAASEREFDEALANQSLTTGSTVSADKGGRVGTGPISAPGHRFTVVVDPGHGGVDGGAESASGTVEKDVTLAFATELRDKLAAVGRYEVY